MTEPTFWLLAALMAATALAGLLPPLLRRQPGLAAPPEDPNLTLLREQNAQLAADREHGLLDAAAYRQAHAELARRALDEIPLAGPAAIAPAGLPPAHRSALAVALGLPLLALAVYLQLGNPAALRPLAASQTAAPPAAPAQAVAEDTTPDVEAMLARLAQRLQASPDDGPGWQMLARSYTALGRFEEASQAYARATRLSPDDAQLLADHADALAMAQGRSAAGAPGRLIERALRLDPRNLKALVMAGSAALERGDEAAAQAFFERARQVSPTALPPPSPAAAGPPPPR